MTPALRGLGRLRCRRGLFVRGELVETGGLAACDIQLALAAGSIGTPPLFLFRAARHRP